MDFNFSAFQEPRGVMRILHFVFSICAFATITGYTGLVEYKCSGPLKLPSIEFSYPFSINEERNLTSSKCTHQSLHGDFSSDAKFFVATGVLAMLYSLAIMVVYAKFDEMYKSNNKLPLYDFVVTVIFGVLWISSSAAWSNGLTGLKTVTQRLQLTPEDCKSECTVADGNFSTLNISVVFGFLNFFLWAADLWFLYKETTWFQGAQPQTTSGV